MNDDELLTMVKGSFAEVRADTPVATIERRGRAVRSRRRRGLIGAVAVAAAASVAVVLTQQPGTSAPDTHLAAWTVVQKRPGIIEIWIRQLTDPAGMQRELRRDGVPAFVRFTNETAPDCLYYRESDTANFKLTQRIFPQPSEAQVEDNVAMVIDTAAIPRGVGLWIEFSPPQRTNMGTAFSTGEELVYASGRCPSGG